MWDGAWWGVSVSSDVKGVCRGAYGLVAVAGVVLAWVWMAVGVGLRQVWVVPSSRSSI